MSLISLTPPVSSAFVPSAMVLSWAASLFTRWARVPACAVRAARAAVEDGSAATSCQADQNFESTLPSPESDGSGNTVSTFASSSRRVFQ